MTLSTQVGLLSTGQQGGWWRRDLEGKQVFTQMPNRPPRSHQGSAAKTHT